MKTLMSRYLSITLIISCFTIVALLSSFNLPLGDNEYSVIKVVGSIVYESSGAAMSTGDKFGKEEKLEFRTHNARAAVIEGEKGTRLVLSGSANNAMNLLPAMNNISSRAGGLNNILDLKLHFSGNILILDKSEVEVNPTSFPLDDDHFFFMQYSHQGESIPKKLGINGSKMVIDKNELFRIDGKPIDQPYQTTMTLVYYDQSENKRSEIGEVTLVFPNLEQLRSEIQVLIDGLAPNMNDTSKIEEITAFLTEFYGKPEYDNLQEWLSTEFGISK